MAASPPLTMAIFVLNDLLAPISEDSPCGPYLEYGEPYLLVQEAVTKPEQQVGTSIIPAEEPEWKALIARALPLFKTTKDLRVAVVLTKGLLRTDGLEGLQQGLELVRSLLESHWLELHPRLETPDDPPIERSNLINELGDLDTTVRAVRNTPLVRSRVLGQFGLRDLAIAKGEVPAPPGTEPVKMDTIAGAFAETPVEQLEQTAAAITAAIAAAKGIEHVFVERGAPGFTTNLEPLRKVLAEAEKAVKPHLEARRAADAPLGDAGSNGAPDVGHAGGARGSASGAVSSRDDVVRVLDRVCEYYARHEPASPVPILLKRCKRLVTMDFMQIMEELAPGGLDEVMRLRGKDEASR
jgi:type VI secretion system protein ImpA